MNLLSTAIMVKRFENSDFELHSVDFLVDRLSLYSATKAYHADLVGRFGSQCMDIMRPRRRFSWVNNSGSSR